MTKNICSYSDTFGMTTKTIFRSDRYNFPPLKTGEGKWNFSNFIVDPQQRKNLPHNSFGLFLRTFFARLPIIASKIQKWSWKNHPENSTPAIEPSSSGFRVRLLYDSQVIWRCCQSGWHCSARLANFPQNLELLLRKKIYLEKCQVFSKFLWMC